jgi:hypothetical protein
MHKFYSIESKDIDNSPYPLRNEVDRFGFSWLMAKHIGIKGEPPKALCNWVHGWKWYDTVDYRLLAPAHPAIRYKTIVVTNERQKLELEGFGFQRVIIGGLPFAYSFNALSKNNINIADIPVIDKERDTLVLLPKCGYDGGYSCDSFNSVLSYVNSSVELRDRSILCVFGGDLNIDEVRDTLKKHKIPFITGSNPYSRVDLIRINKIFSKFKFAVTNTIGSHIPYLAACGVKIKLIEPFNERSIDSFLLSKTIRGFGSDYINYLETVNSKDYFLDRYGDILSFDNFSDDLTGWGLREIGYHQMLDKSAIVSAFGWNMSGRVRAYTETVKFRIGTLF